MMNEKKKNLIRNGCYIVTAILITTNIRFRDNLIVGNITLILVLFSIVILMLTDLSQDKKPELVVVTIMSASLLGLIINTIRMFAQFIIK